MATQYPALSQDHMDFIQQQHLFFVATAAQDGRVNLSPKGMDSFRVLGSTQVLWLNFTGSGNETAAHLLKNNRMTIMFCSFDKQPLIFRIYGTARTLHPRDSEWSVLMAHFPEQAGARQLFLVDIEMVQTSCGFGVPYFEFQGDRKTLSNLADKADPNSWESYWQEKNSLSIDGFDTGILSDK